MIYENGYIAGVCYPKPELDHMGRPVEASPSVGELTTCMYLASVDDKRGKGEDGLRARAAYEVHIAPQDVCTERARLYREDESLIGEFTIQSWTRAKLLGFTRIILD